MSVSKFSWKTKNTPRRLQAFLKPTDECVKKMLVKALSEDIENPATHSNFTTADVRVGVCQLFQ